MTKYCRITDPTTGTTTEHIMGTHPGASDWCVTSGGEVIERDTGCSSKAAAGPPKGSAESSLTASVISPIQTLRDRLPESDVLSDLALVNYAPEVFDLASGDGPLREQLSEAVGMVSQYAFLWLVDHSAEALHRETYTEKLHGWLAEIAGAVQAQTEDPALAEAIDRLVKVFEPKVGEPIGALIASLASGDDDAATAA